LIRPFETAEPEAAANAGWRWQFRFRGLRPWSGVAELGSLGLMNVWSLLNVALLGLSVWTGYFEMAPEKLCA